MSPFKGLRVCTALLICVAALALAGCGKSSSTAANTKQIGTVHAVAGFAVHAGLAFGVFKHYIYKPYEAGKLKLDHPFTVAKAVAAGAFAYHELKEAVADVRDSPHLSKLAAPLAGVGAALALIKADIEHGKSSSAVSSINSQIGSVSSQASSLGSPIAAATSGLPSL